MSYNTRPQTCSYFRAHSEDPIESVWWREAVYSVKCEDRGSWRSGVRIMSISLIRSGPLVSPWTWRADTTYSIGTAGVTTVRDRRHGKYLAHSKLSMSTRNCSITVHFGSCALASTQMSPCISPLQESKNSMKDMKERWSQDRAGLHSCRHHFLCI